MVDDVALLVLRLLYGIRNLNQFVKVIFFEITSSKVYVSPDSPKKEYFLVEIA